MFLLFLFFFLILIVSGSSDQLIEAKILNSGGNSILETHSNSADYFIRQGKVDELPMIVNLRTSIFFPQVTDFSFFHFSVHLSDPLPFLSGS